MANIMLDALRGLIMGAAGDALFPKRETPAPVEDRSVQMPPAQPQGASVQAASPRPVNRNPMTALPSSATTQPYRPTGDSSAMFRSTEPEMQPSNPQMQGINQDMAGFAQQQPKKIDVVNQQLNQQVQEELKQIKPEAAELASQQEIMDSAYAYTLAKNSPTYAQVQEDPELGADFQNTLKKAFGNEEMWLTLAMGFNGMRLRPDATLGNAIADRLKTIRASKTAAKNAPIIAQRLRDMGYPKWAAYVEQNPSQADKLMEQIMQKELKPGAALKTSGVQVDPVTGQMFTVQTDPNTGKVTRVDVGGATGQTPAQEAQLAGKQETLNRSSEIAQKRSTDIMDKADNLSSQIEGLREVKTQLDAGASTGYLQSMAPSFRSASIALDNAVNQLGLSVIGGTTFGALSESELKFALDTAVPTTLPPDELKKWVDRKIAAQEKVRRALIIEANKMVNLGWNDYLKDLEKQQQAAPVSEQPMQTTPSAADVKKQAIEEARKRGLIK